MYCNNYQWFKFYRWYEWFVLGYFTIILLILIQNKLFLSEFNLNYIFIGSLIVILLLNLKNLLFLGDNGSYLLGVFISYVLIETYNQNIISPFYSSTIMVSKF